jgi:hypothetical protein
MEARTHSAVKSVVDNKDILSSSSFRGAATRV